MLPSRQLALSEPPARRTLAGLRAILGRHPRSLSLALYLVVAGLVCSRAWLAPASVAIGNLPDTPQFLWFLRWYPFALAHGLPPLLSDYIDYPTGVNLMWNTSIPLLAIGLTPVTLLAGPIVALNTLTTLAPALSAWTAFLAFRRYVMHPGAAMVGGAIFGFSPYVLVQSQGHPQQAFLALIPLIVMAFDEILIRRQRPTLVMGLALGGLGAAQLLIGEEILVITALAAILGILVLSALQPAAVIAHFSRAAAALGVAGLTFGVLAAYPIGVQLLGPQQPQGLLQPAEIYQTDLFGPMVPTALQLLAPSPLAWITLHFPGPLENGSYLGLPWLGLAYWMARRQWARLVVRWAVLMAAAMLVLSMGFQLRVDGLLVPVPLPWTLLGWLPVLDHVLPVRLMATGFLFAGLLVALFLDQALASTSAPHRRFALVAGGLTLLVLVPRPLPVLPEAAPAFFTSAAVQRIAPGSVVLVAPYSQAYTLSDAMGWQAQAGLRFRMPEGYAYGPHWLNPPPSRLQAAMAAIQLDGDRPPLAAGYRQQLLDELHRWTVDTVLVGPMDNQPAMVDFWTRLLQRPPVQVGGVLVWWQVDR